MPEDTRTPAELLAAADRAGLPRRIGAMLIENPAMPLPGLMKLGPEFPKRFFALTLVRLLIATDPHFVSELSVCMQECFLRLSGDVSERSIRKLAGDPGSDVMLRSCAAMSEHLPSDLALAFCEQEATVRECLARSEFVGIDVLARLAKDSVWKVRWTVAMNTRLPATSYGRLLNDPVSEVRHGLVYRATLTDDQLLVLARDPVAAVARHAERRILAGVEASAAGSWASARQAAIAALNGRN